MNPEYAAGLTFAHDASLGLPEIAVICALLDLRTENNITRSILAAHINVSTTHIGRTVKTLCLKNILKEEKGIVSFL